jgi:hypothetical protein
MRTYMVMTVAYRIRRGLAYAVLAVMLAVTAFGCTSGRGGMAPNMAVEDADVACSRTIARVMGIHYTPEYGATERLGEFQDRVYQCAHDGALPK